MSIQRARRRSGSDESRARSERGGAGAQAGSPDLHQRQAVQGPEARDDGRRDQAARRHRSRAPALPRGPAGPRPEPSDSGRRDRRAEERDEVSRGAGRDSGLEAMAGLLEEHLDALRERGLELEVQPEPGGWVFVVIHKHPLPEGYSKSHVDLLLKVPPPYPNGGMDMFWVDDDLRLAAGT